MNEKFFDLTKEKQDRMINAALKVFACNDYIHASTDEIVKEAGISKGLLFHYFTNKAGLYSFILDYSSRFLALEMSSSVDLSENDYFSLYVQVFSSYLNVMRGYPFLIAFLEKAYNEKSVEVADIITQKKDFIWDKKYDILSRADSSVLKVEVEQIKLAEMIEYTASGIMRRNLDNNPDKPEIFFESMKDYMIMLKNLCCK